MIRIFVVLFSSVPDVLTSPVSVSKHPLCAKNAIQFGPLSLCFIGIVTVLKHLYIYFPQQC